MNDNYIGPNPYITTVLCSNLPNTIGAKPLTYNEWTEFYRRLSETKLDPTDFLDMNLNGIIDTLNLDFINAERISRLFSSKRLCLLSDMTDMLEMYGIYTVTCFDTAYPDKLQKSLLFHTPPLFYYAGALELLSEPSIAFAANREVDAESSEFALQLADAAIQDSVIYVMGHSGISTEISDRVLTSGGRAVIWSADDMIKQYRTADIIDGIEQGRLLIISTAPPSTRYSSEFANVRNLAFYTTADKIVLIKSKNTFGGTWTGIVRNFESNKDKIYCYNNPKFLGNMALIKMGAVPINSANDILSGFSDEKTSK